MCETEIKSYYLIHTYILYAFIVNLNISINFLTFFTIHLCTIKKIRVGHENAIAFSPTLTFQLF